MKNQITRPVFIVGSGRSGSKMMSDFFHLIDQVESHHEYMCTHVQPVAAKYYMQILSKKKALKLINSIYGGAIKYSEKPIWIDSSNKTSWIIDILYELFPNARFVHIVRDGRKVVSSFYYKLTNECYDDKSVKVLDKWVKNQNKYIEPAPEKKYWWNLPVKGSKYYSNFKKFNQFERICFHWGEVTRTILKKFNNLPNKSYKTFRLEDVTSNKKEFKALCKFIDISFNERLFKFLKRPRNIVKRSDRKLTKKQNKTLNDIAGDMMKVYKYDKTTEYDIQY